MVAFKRVMPALVPLMPLLLLTGAAAPGGTLRVEVMNVRAGHGTVHIDVCTQTQFLKDCPKSADAPARIGVTVVTVPDLPAGQYAVQAFLDENNNRKVDSALFGIPKEGVGFSNDAPIRMSPPKWKEAVFTATGSDQTIRLKLRYFLGGDAPRK